MLQTLYKLFTSNHFIPGLFMVKKSVLLSISFLSYISHGLDYYILKTFLFPKIILNLWELNEVTDIKLWIVVTENWPRHPHFSCT